MNFYYNSASPLARRFDEVISTHPYEYPGWVRAIRHPFIQSVLVHLCHEVFQMASELTQQDPSSQRLVRLALDDGSTVSYNVFSKPTPSELSSPSTPVLLLLPTLTGSAAQHRMTISKAVNELNWIVVVIYRQGRWRDLTTARLPVLGDDRDLKAILAHLRTFFPTNPFLAMGLSAGAMAISRYLAHSHISHNGDSGERGERGEHGEHNEIRAAVAICGGWNTKSLLSMPSWVQVYFRYCIRKYYLARPDHGDPKCGCHACLFTNRLRQASLNPSISLENLVKMMYSVPVDTEAQELLCSIGFDELSHVSTQLLLINSESDLIHPWEQGFTSLTQNRYVSMVVTKDGGHCAFPRSPLGQINWAEDMGLKFLQLALSTEQGIPQDGT